MHPTSGLTLGALPYEIKAAILDKIEFEDLGRFCAISQAFEIICQDPEYWRERLRRDYNVTQTLLHPREEYLRQFSQARCTYGSERHRDLGECLHEAHKRRNRRLFDYYVNHAIQNHQVDSGVLRELARANRLDILNQLEPLTDLNSILIGASAGGHRELAEKMMERGADDLRSALMAAAEGGRNSIMQLLTPEIQFNVDDINLLREAVYRAALHGHRFAVAYLLTLGEEEGFNALTLLASALKGYAIGGHRFPVEDLINILDDFPDYISEVALNEALLGVSGSGKPEMVGLLIDAGANQLDQGIELAAEHNNHAVVAELLRRGAKPDNALIKAAERGYAPLVDELVRSLRPEERYGIIDAAILRAAQKNESEVVALLLRQGRPTAETLGRSIAFTNDPRTLTELVRGGALPTDEHLQIALDEGDPELVNVLLDSGSFTPELVNEARRMASRTAN